MTDKNKFLISFLTIAVILFTTACRTQSVQDITDTPNPQFVADLQTALDDWRETNGIVGITLAVYSQEQGRVELASGLSNVENGTSMLPGQRLYAGSITKTFVAAAALQLVEEGKLSLDDTLDRWYPEFPNARQISIRQMLNMTSGSFDYFRASPDNPIIPMLMQDLTKRWRPEETISVVASLEPTLPPGTGHDYSNTNYIFLGLIIEQITGNSLEVELRQRFFEPLSLQDTFLSGREEIPDRFANHYVRESAFLFGSEEPLLNVNDSFTAIETIGWAAGAVVTSSIDLVTWANALYGGDVLGEALLTEMLTEGPYQPEGGPSYGYGVEIWSTSAGTAVGHPGSTPASSALMLYYPVQGIAVAVMANDEWADQKAPLSGLIDELMIIATG